MGIFSRRKAAKPAQYTPAQTTFAEATAALNTVLETRPLFKKYMKGYMKDLAKMLTEKRSTQAEAEQGAEKFLQLAWGVLKAGSAAEVFTVAVYRELGRSSELAHDLDRKLIS